MAAARSSPPALARAASCCCWAAPKALGWAPAWPSPGPGPRSASPPGSSCSSSSSSSPSSSCWGSPPGPGSGRAGVRRRALGAGPRRSASQREKLRMRRLAQALRALRRFLPPSVAPPGQSLTKVETLRLAGRYIAHLGALLARGEEPPAPPCGCPRCAPAPHPPPQAWPGTRSPPLPAWAPQESRAPPPPPPTLLWPAELPATGEDLLPPAQGLPAELLAFLEELETRPGRD